MAKQLTQAGLNMVIWKMLKDLGGKFVITEHELNQVKEEAIRIDYDAAGQAFVLRLCKTPKSVESKIITPGMN